jgi:hypothetical protein
MYIPVLPVQLKKKFEEWKNARDKCESRSSEKCLLLGTPCAYLLCLFRDEALFKSIGEILKCPKCGTPASYIDKACQGCSHKFTEEKLNGTGG